MSTDSNLNLPFKMKYFDSNLNLVLSILHINHGCKFCKKVEANILNSEVLFFSKSNGITIVGKGKLHRFTIYLIFLLHTVAHFMVYAVVLNPVKLLLEPTQIRLGDIPY